MFLYGFRHQRRGDARAAPSSLGPYEYIYIYILEIQI